MQWENGLVELNCREEERERERGDDEDQQG